MSTTSSLPTTQKAVFTTTYPGPFEIKERAVPQEPSKGEIIVRVEAAALNPLEAFIPYAPWGFLQIFPAVPATPTPMAIGHDIAGEVVRVGKGVTNFQIGDRVIASASVGDDDSQAFQSFARLSTNFVSKIPSSLSYDSASTIPMGLNTAVMGLYKEGGLTAPWEGGKGKYAGQAFVVGGGSGSVGQFAIQLAKLNGFSPIIATASAQHESSLKALGATHVVPHSTPPSELKKLAGNAPISVYFLAHTTEETIPPAVETLSEHGLLVTTMLHLLDPVAKPAAAAGNKDLKAVVMIASPYHAGGVEMGKKLYSVLEGLLESGEIVGNQFELLSGGLGAVVEGLKRVGGGTGGVKLVIHPSEEA